jgi:hypothetical protein
LFDGATFSRSASFFGARFACKCTFTNTEQKSNASFEGTTFAIQPPTFFRAKLHEGTTWLDARWPPPPLSRNDAGSFVAAYERLRLEMDRLKKHEDELHFSP